MKRKLTWKRIFLTIPGVTYLVTVSLLAASGASYSHRQLLLVATALTLPFGVAAVVGLYVLTGLFNWVAAGFTTASYGSDGCDRFGHCWSSGTPVGAQGILFNSCIVALYLGAAIMNILLIRKILRRKQRLLTWKTISLTILGATLLAVAVGLAVSLKVGPAVTSVRTATAKSIQPVPFDLYTHCGINELRSNGRYFQRVGGILDDGSRNPPSGWGNPYQHGTLSVSGDVAVFRDKVGHVETFKVRSGATGFLDICS